MTSLNAGTQQPSSTKRFYGTVMASMATTARKKAPQMHMQPPQAGMITPAGTMKTASETNSLTPHVHVSCSVGREKMAPRTNSQTLLFVIKSTHRIWLFICGVLA